MAGKVLRKAARDTLVAVELNLGETLEFCLSDGSVRRITLDETSAEITETTLKTLMVEEEGAVTNYRFSCRITVDGEPHELEREVATQKSFYEPWEIKGLRIWFDAVDDIFSFLTETHGECRPGKDARFALQEASRRICPEMLHPWCPLPEGGLKIEQCYRGEDCWMGAYHGASAHGGLDINHPKGTPLWAPLDVDDHFLFNSLAMGHNNNRWRGFHRWPDGSEWIIEARHMTALTVPEHEPIPKGEQFAVGAGVHSGVVDHSHFDFMIRDEDGTVLLDPWILFWQMYRDQSQAGAGADRTGPGPRAMEEQA